MKDLLQFFRFKFRNYPIFARKQAFLAGRSLNKTVLSNIVLMAILEENILLLPEKTKK